MSVRATTWVWEHSPTAGTARLVLLAIADTADDAGGNAWPSVATLARKTRLDVRTVQRVIRRLVAGGHLRVAPTAGRGGTNVYTVVLTPPG
ncbi:MAG TPA: helix-turn-helix domain-containing protein [Frankiaceae bacterium]|nr:helix-turn-helix domain-containing protein [Frankiaceae bacterium]